MVTLNLLNSSGSTNPYDQSNLMQQNGEVKVVKNRSLCGKQKKRIKILF